MFEPDEKIHLGGGLSVPASELERTFSQPRGSDSGIRRNRDSVGRWTPWEHSPRPPKTPKGDGYYRPPAKRK